MDDISLGWVAGILDGEGSITMNKHYEWRRPGLSVSSTDYSIVERLQVLLGGSISPVKLHGKMLKPQWHWRLNGAIQVLEVLRGVVEHLYCPKKKKRAAWLLEHYTALTPRNGKYTEEGRQKKLTFENEFFAITGE